MSKAENAMNNNVEGSDEIRKESLTICTTLFSYPRQGIR